MRAFFFGNGKSRDGFDIAALRDRASPGDIFIGHNWNYREFDKFDFMFSIDKQPTNDIMREYKGQHYFRGSAQGPSDAKKRQQFDVVYYGSWDNPVYNLPVLPEGFGWNSGRVSMWVISKIFKPAELWLFGFDFNGSNLYTTIHTRTPKNFARGLNAFFGFCGTKVIRVGPVDDISKDLSCAHLTYDDIKNIKFIEQGPV